MNSNQLAFLQEIGLNEGESRVYGSLVAEGEAEARELVERTGLGRGNTYNIVAALEKRGLVVAVHGGAKTRYRATDPSNLRTLLERKQEEVQALKAHFDALLPGLASQYVLSTGKPAIQIFEGLEGVERALHDSLTARGEILTITDPAVITGEVIEINTQYVALRRRNKIMKRLLMPDTDLGIEFVKAAKNECTQARVCPGMAGGFSAVIEIYDQRLSLLTVRDNRFIAVLIENVPMVELQRAQFEVLWSLATKASAP